MPEASTQKRLRPWLVTLTVLSTVAAYCLLHQHYAPTNSDDAWTTSFAYNYFYKGEGEDTVFGRPAGTLIAFGYSYGALQKLVLDLFGWSRSNAILLSTCFLFLSLPFWWCICRQLGCSNTTSQLYLLTLPLWEPIFRIANTARPDACCLFFVAVAFFFAQNRRYLLAGLASGIAFEVHQMGILAFILVAVHLSFDVFKRYKDGNRLLLTFILWIIGIFLGISYYLFLHFSYLGKVFSSSVAMHSWSGNFIFAHFFMTNTYRHIPVLIFTIFAVIVAFRFKLIAEHLEAFCLPLVILLFSITFPRPNIYYSAYFFVFLGIPLSIVIARLKFLNFFLALFLFYILPQYFYIYYVHRNYDMDGYAVAMEHNVPKNCQTITGPFNAWFAFKERQFIGNIPDVIAGVKRLAKLNTICYLRRLDKDDSRDVVDESLAIGPLMKEFDAGGQRFGVYPISIK